MKITFLGDIMCEPPVLKASKRKDGTYNFDGVFDKVRPMLSESDYVISNLEFPMAGEEAKYTDCFFVFNSPDSYAQAAKNAGIDLVSWPCDELYKTLTKEKDKKLLEKHVIKVYKYVMGKEPEGDIIQKEYDLK